MERDIFDPVTMDIPNKDRDHRASIVHLAIDPDGETMLGVLFKAQGVGPHPTAIILHGFPGHDRNLDIAHALRRGGWNSVIFHYRGAWGSEGIFKFSNMVPDTKAVIEYLIERSSDLNVDPENIVLIGHSMGGWASMMTAVELHRIKRIVLIAGFDIGVLGDLVLDDPSYMEHAKMMLNELSTPLRIRSVDDLITEMLNKRAEWKILNHADDLKDRSILMIGAENDEIAIPALHLCPLEKGLKEAGAEDIEIKMIDSDHSFSDGRIELIRTIWKWLDR